MRHVDMYHWFEVKDKAATLWFFYCEGDEEKQTEEYISTFIFHWKSKSILRVYNEDCPFKVALMIKSDYGSWKIFLVF